MGHLDTSLSVPSHVAASSVVDFDFYNLSLGEHSDPQMLIGSLLEGRSPRMFYTPRNGGHWVIGGYRELLDAMRDTAHFSSISKQIPEMKDEPKLIPFNLDPPEHGPFRGILNEAFNEQRVALLEDSIRSLTIATIEKVASAGRAEFVESVSEPIPTLVFMEILGLPKEGYREFRDAVDAFLTDIEKRAAAMEFLNGQIASLIAERRAAPRDDLISRLLSANVNGRQLQEDELYGFIQLLILGGLDTVMNAMSFGVRHLAIDLVTQNILRDDPQRIPAATEELLRRYAFANVGRLMIDDLDFKGVKLKKGDRVLLMPAGAGIDPNEFTRTAEFEIDRRQKINAVFGFGIHRCVGLGLARLELRILYEEWLKRIPEFRIDPTDKPVFNGGVVMGLKHLPLVWDR